MGSSGVALPEGFVLDPPAAGGPPPGFMLDKPDAAALPAGFVLDKPAVILPHPAAPPDSASAARVYPHGDVINGPPLSHLGPSHPVSDQRRLGLPDIQRPQVAVQPEGVLTALKQAVASPWDAPQSDVAAAKASGHDATAILPHPDVAAAINKTSVERTMGAINAAAGADARLHSTGFTPGTSIGPAASSHLVESAPTPGDAWSALTGFARQWMNGSAPPEPPLPDALADASARQKERGFQPGGTIGSGDRRHDIAAATDRMAGGGFVEGGTIGPRGAPSPTVAAADLRLRDRGFVPGTSIGPDKEITPPNRYVPREVIQRDLQAEQEHGPSLTAPEPKITDPIRHGALGRLLGEPESTAQAYLPEGETNPNLLRMESFTKPTDAPEVKAAAEFVGGLTSPGNALLMAGTSGLGALETEVGKSTASKALSLYFSADMLHGAYGQMKQAVAAAQQGDWETARRMATHGALGTVMGALALKHGLSGSEPSPAPPEGFELDKETPNDYENPVSGPARNNPAPGPVEGPNQETAGATSEVPGAQDTAAPERTQEPVEASTAPAPPALSPEERAPGVPREVGPQGPIYHEFYHDAQGAIRQLLSARNGEAPGALFHPAVGDIDLTWGDEKRGGGYGLAKIAARHPEVLDNLQGILDSLTETRRSEQTIFLEDPAHTALVRLNWMGKPKQWLLTAFEKREEPPTGRTIDVSGARAAERQAPLPGGPDLRKPTGETADASGALSQGEGSVAPSGPAAELPPTGRTIDVSGASEAGGQAPQSGDSSTPNLEPNEAPVKAEDLPPGTKTRGDGSVVLGSGLGAIEPFIRESIEEGNKLKAKRDAAQAALDAAKSTSEQKHAGELARAYFTSERDLWGARINQVVDKVKRLLVPKTEDREALTIYREFKDRPQELAQFINGDHQMMIDHKFRVEELAEGGQARAEAQKVYDAAIDRLDALRPVMRQALGYIEHGLPKRLDEANSTFTQIAAETLREGQAGHWLESRWSPEQYVTHLLHAPGEGDVAKPPSTEGRLMGNIGKFFAFGQRRSDPYPTMLHAIADGLVPKTMDAASAFTIHGNDFARARATHKIEEYLQSWGLGRWTAGPRDAPAGWVPLARHSDEFTSDEIVNDFEGNPKISTSRLYVPPYIQKALKPITAPDFLADEIPGFAKLRTFQRGQKRALLGLSGFHLLTENFMAAADMGPSGMAKAFKADRLAPWFQEAEREFIASGGTSAVQGITMDAYRGLAPGTIPTRGEIWLARVPFSKQALELADQITDFTFGNIQRRFKVVSYMLRRDAWMNEHPDASFYETEDVKRGIASYVNGVYGGLHWENIGVRRAMVEGMRALLLAPDWTGSNVALAKYAFDAKLSPQELPFRDRLKGATTKEQAQARLARAFWAKQLIGGMVSTQMLSLMFSQKLSPRPFQVYLGKDSNGDEVYQNVFFRGSIGDAITLATKMQTEGAFGGALDFIGGKAAPVTRSLIHQGQIMRQAQRNELGGMVNTLRSVGFLTIDNLPVPMTVRNAFSQATDDTGKYLYSERVLGQLGPQAQHVAPEGTYRDREGVLHLNPVHRQPENSFIRQAVTGKARQPAPKGGGKAF